jgi:hypothetical protein
MTANLSRIVRQAGFVMAVAISASALNSTASFAYTAEQAQMCTGDAFRFCSTEIPNIPAVMACMVKHRTELSAGCRAVMDRDLGKKSSKVAATQ